MPAVWFSPWPVLTGPLKKITIPWHLPHLFEWQFLVYFSEKITMGLVKPLSMLVYWIVPAHFVNTRAEGCKFVINVGHQQAIQVGLK